MTTRPTASWHTFNDQIDPHAIISLLPIHRSQHVAVLGGDVDGLTIPIAKYVYDGNVIALDSDQETLDQLAIEVKRVHLTNVDLTLVDDDDLTGTEIDTDGIVVIDALHQTTSPARLFSSVARLLPGGGWMLIADWFSTDARGDNGPAKSKRVDAARVDRWASENDMTPITRRTLGVQRYVHVYRKRRAPSN
ncbi:MAG: methyltransferase domain-containing protein [Chloroflexi bacterium]|nr:methyltransferase domain-containing protein [Chloroflexota bacterium]